MKVQYRGEYLLEIPDQIFLNLSKESNYKRYFADDAAIKVFRRMPKNKGEKLTRLAERNYALSKEFEAVADEDGSGFELKDNETNFYVPLISYDTDRFLAEMVASFSKYFTGKTRFFHAELVEEPGCYALLYVNDRLNLYFTPDDLPGNYSGEEVDIIRLWIPRDRFVAQMYQMLIALEVGYKKNIEPGSFGEEDQKIFFDGIRQLKRIYKKAALESDAE